jgi:hypothetical protein
MFMARPPVGLFSKQNDPALMCSFTLFPSSGQNAKSMRTFCLLPKARHLLTCPLPLPLSPCLERLKWTPDASDGERLGTPVQFKNRMPLVL